MRWNYLSVSEPGCVPCTVCGREFPDPSIRNGEILYFPNFRGDSDAWQADWIRRIWQVDPYADFAVCEECMQGHCDAVYGLNATTWLDNKIEEYLLASMDERGANRKTKGVKFPAKFYIHCPECGQRMRRVAMEGNDIYSVEIGYACPCGCHWTYSPNRNSLERGLPAAQEEEGVGA